MEDILSCVVCLRKCTRVAEMKRHMTSHEHTQNISQVFKNVSFHSSGFFPQIKKLVLRCNSSNPVVGLPLLTLCFSAKRKSVFYLCHTCEEMVSPETVDFHMHSEGHVSNYYNFTDPNRLFFAWLPDDKISMSPKMIREILQSSKSMQLLDMPQEIFIQFYNSTYFEVMSHISKKLLSNIGVLGLRRIEVEAYQNDAEARNPLLGMQHIVECTTTEERRKCCLCTLCKQIFPKQLIIKHVLSYDHVFSYFAICYPSPLLHKESYTQNKKTFIKILNVNSSNKDVDNQMRKLRLDPDVFDSVNFSSYYHALGQLELIAKERHEHSLVVNITPENKRAWVQSWKIYCQNCNASFPSEQLYFEHVRTADHLERQDLLFGRVDNSNHIPSSYENALNICRIVYESTLMDQQAVGSTLVTLGVGCWEMSNMFFVCFACELVTWHSALSSHINSKEHHISTLMYLNPWLLPFGWKDKLNVPLLKDIALEEEQKRGPKLLKLLDIPEPRFSDMSALPYDRMMEMLSECDRSIHCREPPWERFSTLSGQRFPLLGLQFIVKYFVSYMAKAAKFVCLLCQRKLKDDTWHCHLISRQHVAAFLDNFHPGSVNVSTTELELLDLAVQATAFHQTAEVQEITLSRPIPGVVTIEYLNLISILQANKQHLRPPISRQVKLVPRTSGTIEDPNHIVQAPSERSERLDIHGGGNTSVSTNEDSYRKESQSEPSEAAGSVDKMGQEKEVTLKSTQHNMGVMTQGNEQRQSEQMMDDSAGIQEAHLGSPTRGEGLPGQSSEREMEPQKPMIALETSSCEGLQKTTTEDVYRASPLINLDRGDWKPCDVSYCSSQNNMVDTAENFHLNIPQEPVYWPETPTSEGLGSPIASFTQNPNATTCVTGSTTCENEVALKGVPMSDTNPGNMDRTTQVSVSPQIASPRTVRTTERSMSTDNSRQAGKRTKDKRPPRIGLRYIITVMCGDKQQVYCQLCSVRLNHSTHLSSLEHQRKYIIKRFPNWNATSVDENELAKMVNKLADMDKCLSDQKVKVGFDMYQNLAVLPEGKAILALREILSAQRKQNPSLAPRLDDVSSPRSHSSKDSAQKTPGHSTSAQSSTKEDQKSGNGKPLKAGCTMGSSSQNLLKDIQKSSEKALPGFSSKHKELSRNDHCSLQSSRKHQNTTSVEDKPLEAPMTSTGCSSTNQFLMKDNHEGPPSGSYTVHWELHEALGDSIHTANQSTVNGHTPGENILFLQHHQNEQQMPEHGLGSVGTSEVGEKDLCSILKKNDVEPVIGLALIWVCQVSPESTDPAAVYLCESCSKKMMISELCQHLVSVEHQINYLRRGYPHLVYFWFLEDLHQWMKENILEDVVRTLAVREQHFKKRAQSVCLSQVLYNMVKEGSFCNALKIAQHCKKNVSM